MPDQSMPDWPSLWLRQPSLQPTSCAWDPGFKFFHNPKDHGDQHNLPLAYPQAVAATLCRDQAHAYCLELGWYIREQRHKEGRVSCALVDTRGMDEINGGESPNRDWAIFNLTNRVLDSQGLQPDKCE